MYYPAGNFVKDSKTNKVTMLRPAVFTCGCGSVTARLGSILQFVNIRSNQIDQIRPNAIALAKEWIQQEGLYEKCPLLKQHVFGIFITPKGEWLDLNQGTTQDVAERFRKIYDEYSNN